MILDRGWGKSEGDPSRLHGFAGVRSRPEALALVPVNVIGNRFSIMYGGSGLDDKGRA